MTGQSMATQQRFKRVLFDDVTATGYDAAIVLLLAVFMLSTTFSIAVMNISYGAAAILWLGRMAYRRRNEIPTTPLDWFFAAYVFVLGLATVFAYDVEQSTLYMYRRITLLPLVYVVFAQVRSVRTLKVLMGALIASMLFVSLWSLRDVVLHLHEYLLFERRLREFQMYMTAGGMMMIGLLILLPFIVHPATPKKIRWLALLALLPIGTNLLFTFTRSSWLGFLTGAGVIAIVRAKRIVIPLVAIVVAVVFFSPPEMQDRISSIINPYHPNNVTRLHMWQTGWRIFLDHPLIGIGDIGVEKVWSQYAQPGWAPEGHLHNNIIMWGVTLGVAGLLALVALFVKQWFLLKKIERQAHQDWFLGSVALGALAVVSGFHVNGLFEWNFGDAEIIMVIWTLTGLTLGAQRLASEKSDG